MGYIGMFDPKGDAYLTVLVRNRVFILAVYYFFVINNTINKSLSCALHLIGLNWGANYKADLKQGIKLRARS